MYKRGDREFVLDMYSACKRILRYVEDVDYDEFLKTEEKQDAVIRNVEILGEASKNVSKEFREKYPEVEWEIIAKTRDKTIHFYFGVDLDIIWKIATRDVPLLTEKLQRIIKSEGWENET